MRRDGVSVLAARGYASAFVAAKALLLALLLNVLLGFVLARPVGAAFHETLDEHPAAARLFEAEPAGFMDELMRSRPAVLGDVHVLDALATGGAVKKNLLSLTGGAGFLVWGSIASALLAAVLAGGFAGRFGAERERASLSAFGADCGRFAFSSLLLGLVSLAGIVLAYRYVFAWPGTLYEPDELRYEWEAVALLLTRLLAFLVAAALVRLVVLYARAEIGITRNGNPFLAIATAAGFVAARPARTVALEILFGAAGLVPLLAWGAWAPAWNGLDPVGLVLVVLGQQLVIAWRIASRAAHLGAASAFLRRSREIPAPTPASHAVAVVAPTPASVP
jgi:hypothetical protein